MSETKVTSRREKELGCMITVGKQQSITQGTVLQVSHTTLRWKSTSDCKSILDGGTLIRNEMAWLFSPWKATSGFSTFLLFAGGAQAVSLPSVKRKFNLPQTLLLLTIPACVFKAICLEERRCGPVHRAARQEPGSAGLQSQLWHLLAVWPQTDHLTFPCFNFPRLWNRNAITRPGLFWGLIDYRVNVCTVLWKYSMPNNNYYFH